MQENRDTGRRPKPLDAESESLEEAGNDLTFLPMCRDDLDEVATVEKLCFVDPWSRGSFAAELVAGSVSWCRVLRVGERLAGYIIVWFVEDESHLANIAVAPWARRHGFAQRMLDSLYRESYLRGSRMIVLEVRASNSVAVDLYERNGFVAGGIRKNYYSRPREDALLMVRFLRRQEI